MVNGAYKLDKGSIRCINKVYRKKIGRKTTAHDIIIATSGYAAMIIAVLSILCMETYTLPAFIVGVVSTAWAMLFMIVNAEILNKRIRRYWRKKINEWNV